MRSPKTPSSPNDTDLEPETDEYYSYVRLDRLEKLMTEKGSKCWKRTLAPSPLERVSLVDSDKEVWYRQMDISLNQLQRLAENMGDSLDEQVRLANLLTIYLNYGADQVINIKDKLNVAQKKVH